jgi:asparagine synthase (glutamine-hydrolysing)
VASRSAPTTTSCRPAGRRGAPARARDRVRRALRRLVGAADVLVSRLAAGHVKVALSGEGGDELFGGYYTYVADLLAPRLGPIARLARPVVERLPTSTGKVSLDYKAKRFVRSAGLPPLERHVGWKEIFSADARSGLLAGRAGRTRSICTAGDTPNRRGRRRSAASRTSTRHLPRRRPAREGRPGEHGPLPRDDGAVPRPGRRGAGPRAADRHKVRGLTTKRLFRRAVRDLLPPTSSRARSTASRSRSRPGSGDRCCRSPATCCPRGAALAGFFEPAAVQRLIEEHATGRVDQARPLWNLLMFGLWYEAWARPGSEPALAELGRAS